MISKLDCHALIIGIDGYSGGFAQLRGAVNDATAIADVLATEHNYSIDLLLDAQASGTAIKQHLAVTLPGILTERSALLIYFAGHGDARGDGTEGAQGYLLPHDASKSDENSWFSMADFRELLEGLPCRHLLVVLDCCFAGAFRWSATRGLKVTTRPLYQSQFDRYLRETSWQALTSAAHDELAADAMPGLKDRRESDGNSGHSPFTTALLAGLRGEADSSRGGNSSDGVITATELNQFISEEFASNVKTRHQTPGLWPLKTDNKGEFVFANPATDAQPKPDPPLTDESNPWLGLKTYSASDNNLFFGRQRVIESLAKILQDEDSPSLLAVVGASGTGKSSVVKAGLIPLILNSADSNWRVIKSERLIGDPNRILDTSISELELIDNDSQVLLLIDQFEELYTQCPSEDDRDRFLRRLRKLIDAEDGPKVVVTIRSDFEPRPSKSDALAEIWEPAKFLIPAFNIDELREVIEGPANVMALFFEPDDLVSRLLDEVLAMPGALPLLSFALAEMYRHAQLRRRKTGASDRALTEQDYVQAGGVIGALHKRASLLYDEADDGLLRNAIEKMFLRMVSQESGLTRRRVLLNELVFADEIAQQHIDEARQRYIDARLLVVDDQYIEPAHDTLVVAWDKLRGWLDNSGSQHLARSVWQAASEWQANQNADKYLWHNDPRLQQAVELHPQLNKLERSFVVKSEARRKRNRRSMLVVIAVVMGAILGLSLWAWLGAQRVLEQALQMKSEVIASLVQTNDDAIVKALLLNELAEQKLPEPGDGMQIMHAMNAQIAAQTVSGIPNLSKAGWDFIAMSDPSIATVSITNNLRLQYSNTGRKETMSGRIELNGNRITTVATLGRPELRKRDPIPLFAVGFNDGLIALRNRDREVHTFETDGAISAITFATGADSLVVASEDGTGRLIWVNDPDTNPEIEIQTIGEEGSAPLVAIAVDAQALLIAMADNAGTVQLLRRDGPSHKLLQEIQHRSGITAISLSGDGSVLAVGTSDGEVAIWRYNDDSWQPGKTLDHNGAAISAVAVSLGGTVIASLTKQDVWLWQPEGLKAPVRRQIGDQAELDTVARLRFTQDQRQLDIVTETGALLRTPVIFPVEGSWDNKVSAGAYQFAGASDIAENSDIWQKVDSVSEDKVTLKSPESDTPHAIPIPEWNIPPTLQETASNFCADYGDCPKVEFALSSDGATAAIRHGSKVFWALSIWDLKNNRQIHAEQSAGRLRKIWFANDGKGFVLSPTNGLPGGDSYLPPVAYMVDEKGTVKKTVLDFADAYQPFTQFDKRADTIALWGTQRNRSEGPTKLYIWRTARRFAPLLLATRDGTIETLEFDEAGDTLRVSWSDGYVVSYSLDWDASIDAIGKSTIACLTDKERARFFGADAQQRNIEQTCRLK